MSTPLPVVAPDWATDANYPAGSDPWSGHVTKSAPSAGKVGTGLVPDTDLAAEEFNYVLANHGQYIAAEQGMLIGRGFHFSDDFMNSTIQNWWDAAGATPSFASGSYGLCTLVGAGAYLNLQQVSAAELGTATDFYLEMLAKNITITTWFGVGFDPTTPVAVAGSIIFKAAAPGHWFYNINNGGDVDTGVLTTATYQRITMRRDSGTIGLYIDNVLVHSTSSSVNIGSSNGGLGIGLTGGGTSALLDYVKMWANR